MKLTSSYTWLQKLAFHPSFANRKNSNKKDGKQRNKPCKFHFRLNQETEVMHILQNIPRSYREHLRPDGRLGGGIKGKKRSYRET